MGTRVSGLYGQTKQQFSVATEASSAITVPDNGMAIFVGTAMEHRQLQALKRLEQCRDAAREFQVPQNDEYNQVTIPLVTGSAVDKVTPTSGATAPNPTENNVALIWRTAFPYPASTQYLTDVATRLVEKYKEDVLKRA